MLLRIEVAIVWLQTELDPSQLAEMPSQGHNEGPGTPDSPLVIRYWVLMPSCIIAVSFAVMADGISRTRH